MEDKIQKIIICLASKTDNTIKGFVVIRDKSVETLGFGEANPKEHLSELYPSLLSAHPEVAKEESPVKALLKSGSIQKTATDLIVGVECDAIEGSEKFTICYAYGKRETIYLSDCYDAIEYKEKFLKVLKEIAKIYGIEYSSSEELIILLTDKGFLKERKIKKVSEPEPKTDTTPITVTRKGLIALGLGVALVSMGLGIGGTKVVGYFKAKNEDKQSKQNEEHLLELPTADPFADITTEVDEITAPQEEIAYAAATPTPTPTPVSTSTPTSVPTVKPTPIPTVEPTYTPLPTVAPRVITAEERALMRPIDLFFYNPEDNPELVRIMTNKEGSSDQSILTGEGFGSIEMGLSLAYDDVSSYVNYAFHGEEKPDYAYLVHFENYFPENSSDRYLVKYFSDLRNDIIYLYYKANDAELAQTRVREAVYEVLRFYAGGPIEITVDGQKYVLDSSNLSTQGIDTIVSIVDGFHQMLGDQEIEFNGQIWDRIRIDTEIYGRTYEGEYGISR